MPDVDEFGLIARYFAPLAASEPGAFGLTDDAAAIAPVAGEALIVTADMLVADVHFLATDPPRSIGLKALGVNLSDLASMGATPSHYLLCLALPTGWTAARVADWLSGFTAGLAHAQVSTGIRLVGGDTVGTPGPLSIAITAFGSAAPERVLRRTGAQPGDMVYVSGTIGDGVLGLRVLQGNPDALDGENAAHAVDRYRSPSPRLALGRAIAGIAHACADVSDGLVADLGHICAASGVCATLDARRIPLSPAGRVVLARDPQRIAMLVTGGDDYELVFTAPASATPAIAAAAERTRTPIAAIGRIDSPEEKGGEGAVKVLGQDAYPIAIDTPGWRHL